MITFSAHQFDFEGDHRLEPNMGSSDFSPIARRVSRIATLDGSAVIVDNGYSASDATFVISLPDLSLSQREALLSTIKRHALIVVSGVFGCYLGAVERVDESAGFKIRFLVKTSLTE